MDNSVTSRTPLASVTSLLNIILRLSLMGRALEDMGIISRLVMINSRVIQMTISSDVERKVGVWSKPGEADSLQV